MGLGYGRWSRRLSFGSLCMNGSIVNIQQRMVTDSPLRVCALISERRAPLSDLDCHSCGTRKPGFNNTLNLGEWVWVSGWRLS